MYFPYKFAVRPAPLADPALPDRLPFTKMEGLGNDYVYVDETAAPIANPGPLAARISDRHFGVGGDGLILIGASELADFRMRMFNVDGTEGEMCGNATRCVGKYVYEHGLTDKTEITLETLGGVRVLHLDARGGRVAGVRVNMGRPRLRPEEIPMNAAGDSFINRPVTAGGETFYCTAVSMGNPHLVVMAPDLDALDLPALGPCFERHELFPQRVNTEFIQVLGPDRIRQRTWERGTGETLACGSGASAALVACALNGLTGRSATVELRGGELSIEWAGDGIVYKTGPAVEVFSGLFRTRD